MISLEKAKALKEAGLPWEPKRGDKYQFFGVSDVSIMDRQIIVNPEADFLTWLPSLSQLLAKIDTSGYTYSLYKRTGDGRASMVLWTGAGEVFDKWSTTPEDAAADALIWLLGQEQKESPEREQK